MNEPTITCPNCQTAIPLTESIAAPLVADARRQYEEKLQTERKAIAEEEAKKGEATGGYAVRNPGRGAPPTCKLF
jgi:hypothetical protein